MNEPSPTIDTIQPTQPTTPIPPTPQETPVVQKPKKKFRLGIKLAIPLFIILVIIGIFAVKWAKSKIKYFKDLNTSYQTEQVVTPLTIDPISEWAEFKNEEDKVTFKYPKNAKFEESSPVSSEAKTYTVRFSGAKQTEELTTDDKLVDGFIFKVAINKDVINKDIYEVAERKLRSYQQKCLSTYSYSNVNHTAVDTVPAESFVIYNCPINYEEIFVLFNNSVYEIVLMYKGDVGYKEQYAQNVRDIFSSYQFLDKPQAPEAPKFQTYYNEEYAFSLVHPLLDKTCCNTNGPVYGDAKRIVVFGDKRSYDANNGKSFNGFGIYIDENAKGLSFEEYMETQKLSLKEDYKVITGKKPDTSEAKVNVGSIEATVLKGYAWWGDVIYLQIPNTAKFMVLSKSETSPGVFDQVFDEILKTFKFGVKKETK